MTTQTEALKLALEALESCYQSNTTMYRSFDKRKTDTAITAIKEALAQPEQEPVAIVASHLERVDWLRDEPPDGTLLYTTPPQRKPLSDWIDPNDKTQKRYLPNIGEPVLFCHEGKTYYGQHNGGSFQYGYGKRNFNTWECRWMYLPAAHGIKE